MNHKMRHVIVIGLVLFVDTACGASSKSDKAAGGVNLAALDGWNIVVADDAIASEKYAAQEFQDLLRHASGLKLPIVHKIRHSDKRVFIGVGEVMRAGPVGFGVEDLGPEDLHILVRDQNIAIAGGRPRRCRTCVIT